MSSQIGKDIEQDAVDYSKMCLHTGGSHWDAVPRLVWLLKLMLKQAF